MRRMLPIIGLLPLLACASTTAPPPGDAPFFEIELVNFAWVPTWRGVVVDSTGAAHGFDLEGAPWEHAAAEYVARDALLEKWQHRRTARGQLEPSALATLARRAAASESAPLQPAESRCNDAGVITYSSWRYDPVRAAYHRTVVRREGDVVQESTSAAGRALGEQLARLGLVPRIDGCSP